MTESEWQTSTQAHVMLCFLDERCWASPRKLRLYACACCRLVAGLLEDERSRQAIAVAERFADGLASARELRAAGAAARAVVEAIAQAEHLEHPPVLSPAHQAARAAAATTFRAVHPFGGPPIHVASSLAAAIDVTYMTGQTAVGDDLAALQRRQANLLREVFGNPFRPVTRPPSLAAALLHALIGRRARPVLELAGPRDKQRKATEIARRIYDEGRFHDLPRLADALEEAGCHTEALLAHCRSAEEHVRGCWALDAVLGLG
jgi:hypothetical protein